MPEAEAYQALGLTYVQYENYSQAADYLKRAVELNPKLYQAWYNLGVIYIHTKEGYNYFKKTTQANPDFAAPYYWQAYYECQKGKDKKAIATFKRYLEVAEGDETEARRINTAKEVLQDLLSGEEGENLRIIRRGAQRASPWTEDQELSIEEFHSKVAKVDTNMPSDKVKEIMGKPDLIDEEIDVSIKDQDTVWTYNHPVIDIAKFIVIFKDNKVALSSMAVKDATGSWNYITRKEFGIE